MRLGSIVSAFALGLAISGAHAANPAAAFAQWSAFPDLDLAKLGGGKIVTETNSSMRFDRGIFGQAAFVLDALPPVCARVMLTRDPAKHPELEIYRHQAFRDEREAAFDSLTLDRTNGAVKSLLGSVSKRDELQLTPGERAKLPRSSGAPEVARFFAQVLRDRWLQAQHGDLSSVNGHDLRAEIKSLLDEEPKLARHFTAVLQPLKDPAIPFQPAHYYWDLSKVNGTATAQLGAVFVNASEERTQMADVVFYASSGYITSVTLSEYVPVTLEGRPRSLCWQGSLVSSTELTGAFGVKRPIAGMLMKREMEQSVRLLQRDVAAAKN